MMFHEHVRMRERRGRAERAPRAAAVTARAPAALPFAGPHYKWWAAEVRFDRPLSRREVRVLERAYDPWSAPGYGSFFGADGMVWSQWWNKWPGEEDGEELAATMRRVGVPGVMRAAPFGRDCPGGWTCPSGLSDGERCTVGAAWSCSPVFAPADWIAVFPPSWSCS